MSRAAGLAAREGRLRALVITADNLVSFRRGGGAIRTWNLVRGFERNGISTTIWSLPPGGLARSRPLPGDIIPERTFGGRERASAAQKLRALASSLPEEVWRRPAPAAHHATLPDACDVAIFMSPAATQLLGQLVQAGIPTVLDIRDDFVAATTSISATMPGRIARWRTRLDARKWAAYQRRLMSRMSLVVAASERDAASLRLTGRAPVIVRPNGVDTRAYSFVDHRRPVGERLLMTGFFGYAPNADAAQWLANEIMPRLRQARPGATLRLVGRDLAAGPWPDGVSAEIDVPDIRSYFDSADVFVAPLRAGGGTRLKLLEAFAKGLPAISTTVGCESLPVQDGVHLLIADSTDDIVRAAIRLLDDGQLRAQLTGNARRLVEREFDWIGITDAYARDLFAAARGEVGTRYHRPP